MFLIVADELLAPGIMLFKIQAPEIARKAAPGQFVIVRLDEKAERIPLTIADFDREAGTVTLIIQALGRSTIDMCALRSGSGVLDVVGPLGQPSELEGFKQVVCIGGGLGIAPVYPIARAFKEQGTKVVSIIGARNREFMFWEDMMRAASTDLHVTTDDGSLGRKGFVTTVLSELLAEGLQPDMVLAIGPLPMMKAVSDVTRPYQVYTRVSMNPIMVDGTGMCGACRVKVGSETRFACVDGPEFDGHRIDWDLARLRANMFKLKERQAMEAAGQGGAVN